MIPAAAAAAAAVACDDHRVSVYIDVVDTGAADIVAAHIGPAVVDLRALPGPAATTPTGAGAGATAPAGAAARRLGDGRHRKAHQNDSSQRSQKELAEGSLHVRPLLCRFPTYA